MSKANADRSDTVKPDMWLGAGLLPTFESSALPSILIDTLFQTFRYLNGFIALTVQGKCVEDGKKNYYTANLTDKQ